MSFMRSASVVVVLAIAACNSAPAKPEASSGASAANAASVGPPVPAASAGPQADGALRLGAPIDASAPKVALSDVAKTPGEYTGKTFATTGTVSAVCQHMGCWMELKDEATEAHIKMAGHAFFVPKTASGRKARVLATLVSTEKEAACEGEGHGHGGGTKKGCKAEAEAQLGRPLAKLELVAQGVELL